MGIGCELRGLRALVLAHSGFLRAAASAGVQFGHALFARGAHGTSRLQRGPHAITELGLADCGEAWASLPLLATFANTGLTSFGGHGGDLL